MLPERGPKPEPDRITLEEVISNAQEIMLQNGQHVPTLIIEASRSLVAGQIPDMPPTHGERVELMRFLGQAAARSGRVDQVRQVFMVSEGWMSMAGEDKQPQMRPSEDPQRKEVLIVSAIQMKERKKQLKLFEIVRDKYEQVVGFEEIVPDEEKKEETVDVPLLDAFVQGFQTAFRIRFN